MLFGVTLRPFRNLTAFTSAAMIGFAALFGTSDASANSKYAAFVYDANAGKVLFARSADKQRYPASLTKMMTLYLVFDAIDAGKITLNTQMKVSRRAAAKPPSKLYLKIGGKIRVKDAILALVTKSANDVATVIAEHIGGTESNFAALMTRKARSIGMKSTTFANASGLPNTKQRTTARDMARLGLSLRTKHPRSFRYFATRSFRYGKAVYRNHNRLLGNVKGVNGIKTGYIRASGFNLVTNVETDGKHLVAVVMGGRSGRTRNAHMATLIHRHLKKASRKKAKTPKTPLIVTNSIKPKLKTESAKIPTPEVKPETKIVSTTPLPEKLLDQTPKPNPVIVAADIITDNKIEQGSQGGTATRPPAIVGKRASVEVSTSAKTETASASKLDAPIRKGWKIQLSASPNLEAAQGMLLEASKKGAPILSTKTPYTEPVQKGDETLYRVRFAGFVDKNAARRACAYMKKKRYRCIYIN